MAYNFPNERRRVERRGTRPAPYAGAERRLADRRNDTVKLVRKPEPMHRGVLWASVLMVLALADGVFLDGAYRRIVFEWFSGSAAAIRYWSDHLWDWGH